MKFSEAKGHKVVDKSTATTVGKVRSLLVDPGSCSVAALRLKKSDRGEVLRWGDLIAFGVDAVTIDDPAAIAELDGELKALRGKRGRLLKKRVLTTGGDELGEVSDVEFNPDTGKLTAILLQDGEIAGERLVNVGSYAVVVKEEPAEDVSRRGEPKPQPPLVAGPDRD